MKVEVHPETIAAATKCEKGLACIANGEPIYCKVEHRVMHRLHFITCLSEDPCPYCVTMEGGKVCTCPVRKEIFDRYHE